MVDFGVARRQEPVPTNLAEARRMEWQTLPFSRISNDEGNTLVVLLPPSEHLAEEAQIAEYARQNPERAVILWLTPRGSERVSDSSPERGVSDLELVLRCLSNSTTFNEERNAVDKQSRIQDFATRLDEALGTGPFNPIENLDPMQALYNIYTYSKNDSRGFFAEVANETDQEAQQAMGNILLERMRAVFGADFDYEAAARNEATFNGFLDMFSSYLGQGLYHEACVSAVQKIQLMDDSTLREMYIMAVEGFAGLTASTVRQWAADERFLENAADIEKFGAMVVNAVGTESFIGLYPSEFWTSVERLSRDRFMEGMNSLVTGFSLSTEAKEGITAEMYANWFVTTNPTLRSALAVEFFRVTGQDIGSADMADLFKLYFPDRILQARL